MPLSLRILLLVAALAGCGGEDEGDGSVAPEGAMIELSRGVSFEALGFHVGERIDAVADGLAVPGAVEASTDLGGVDAIGITPGDCFVGGCKHVFFRGQDPDRYLVVRNLYSEDEAPSVAVEDEPLDAPAQPELGLPAKVDAPLVGDWLEAQRRGLDAAVAVPDAQAVIAQVEMGYVDAGAYLTVSRFLSTGCSSAGCRTSFFALQREDFGSVEPADVGTLVVEAGMAALVEP